MAKKKGKRRELLESLAAEPRTLVFYESPRRVAAFLEELRLVFGNRPAVLARELTKLHEEFIRGSISEILAALENRPAVKGECTLLVAGAAAAESISDAQLSAVLRQALSEPGAHLSNLSRTLSRHYNLPRKRVYEMALSLQKQTEESS